MDNLHSASRLGMPDPELSPLRGKLASYDNAYRVALNLTAETNDSHLVVATGVAFQPHIVIRTSDILPGGRLHNIVQLGWIIAHVEAAA